MTYNFKSIEKKWQKLWDKTKAFQVKEDKKREKFYVVPMYPYPSGTSLHMGHAFMYTIPDVIARFKRLNGFNVLHPIGYDSFGLPAENAAIQEKSHPKKFTEIAIRNFSEQFRALGISYDFSRVVKSHDPGYYKWDQWIFLKMLEKNLAYRKKAPVNWCRKCNTVLANEQVIRGRCWRHDDTEVEIKNLEQWFLKITEYADEIYESTKKLDWPQRIKTMQENWIGKSQGAEIVFEINGKKYPVFTTRADTLFGATFMVISSQHPELAGIVSEKQKKDVEKFLKKIHSTKQEEIEKLDKEGVFTGSYALHPLTNEKIPVWTGNFVIAEYGSGIVMAVPAHDQRDFEFAQKYKLPIRIVVKPKAKDIGAVTMDKAYEDFGKLVNSGEFNGLESEEAKIHIVKALERKKLGRFATHFKLRDWLISRQRFWGVPIPVVYCKTCGIVSVEEKDLPVKLPENIKFKGIENPLVNYKKFTSVKCPRCKKPGARRETDTMDTFVNSSWYFLRYLDPKNKKRIFDGKKADYWMPMDLYMGGAEHACLHLIYSRFYTKFLRDLGLFDKRINEPAKVLFNQGMVHGRDGFVMSKSRGNGVDPKEMMKKFGADSLRLYLVSNASPDKDFNWDDKGIEGSFRFLKKVHDYFEKAKFGKSSEKLESKVNLAIKDVAKDIEYFNYNLAVISLRKLFDLISEEKTISDKDAGSFLKMLHLFTPHITEELWHGIGNKSFLSLESWPKADEKKINPEFEKEEKLVDDLVNDINNISSIMKGRGKKPEKVYIYAIPKELYLYNNNLMQISRRTGLKSKIYAVNDKSKHDPEKKSKKARPGKPGVYIE